MQILFKAIKKLKAVSTIEIILVVAMFSVMVLGISSTVIYVIRTSATSTAGIQATQLANEGLEAVRDMKMDNNAVLANGTYGLSYASGKWVFSGTTDNTNSFLRSVSITDDTDHTTMPSVISKKITSTVTWNSGANSYSISTLMTNWQRYKTVYVGYWGHPKKYSSLDINLGTYTMTRTVKVGNYLYGIRQVSGTNNLIVMDITDPANPAYVTQFSVLGIPYDIVNSGNYLYISTSDNNREISVVDITTRTNPVYYSAYNANSTPDEQGLYIVGNRLYATRVGSTSSAEFEILNITNPASISLVGQYKHSANATVYDCVVIGNYAYLATAGDTTELMVINITAEASPVLLTSFDIPTTNDAYYIEPVGTSNLLISDVVSNVYSISISNPAAPSILSSLNAGARVYQIDVNADNSRAFCATALAGAEFTVLNISNLSSISTFGAYNDTGSSIWYSVLYDSVNDYIYGTGNTATGELIVLKASVTNWRAPTVNSSLDVTGTQVFAHILKVGNYLYGIRAVAGSNNLVVIDVTDPNAPAYVTQFSVNGTPVDLTYQGNYLYVASTDDTREVTVVNITTPGTPVYAGYYDASGTADPTCIENFGTQRLYLCRTGSASSEELAIVDIITPASPATKGVYNSPSDVTINAIEKVGNYIYATTTNTAQELLTINITTETAPALAGSLNLSGAVAGGRVRAYNSGANLLVADTTSTIYSVSISTPATPAQLTSASTGGKVNEIAVSSDSTVAIMATNYTTYDLEIMNIANPSQLTPTYGYDYTANLNDIYYDQALDRVFSATTNTAAEVVVFKPVY